MPLDPILIFKCTASQPDQAQACFEEALRDGLIDLTKIARPRVGEPQVASDGCFTIPIYDDALRSVA